MGDESRVSRASLEQENQSHLQEAIDPWLCTIESQANIKLLLEAEQEADTHVIEFDRTGLVRTDRATMAQVNTSGLSGYPWITPNEARASMGLDPVEDGDELKIPANNFGPVAEDQDEPEEEAPGTEEEEDTEPPAEEEEAGERMTAAQADLFRKNLTATFRRAAAKIKKPSKNTTAYFKYVEGDLEKELRSILQSDLPTLFAALCPGVSVSRAIDNIVACAKDVYTDPGDIAVNDLQLYEMVDRAMDEWAAGHPIVITEKVQAWKLNEDSTKPGA